MPRPFLTTTLLAAAIFGLLRLPDVPPSSAKAEVSRSAYTRQELDYFKEVALGSEFFSDKSARIRKWQGDVNIQYFGSPTQEDLVTLRSLIQELNELTSGSIRLKLVTGKANVTIYFAPESQFPKMLKEYRTGNSGYAWSRWNENYVIKHADILITTTKVTQRERSHLLREELTQSLGLLRDSLKYPNSVFYQPWTDVTQYSVIDKALIRMLYSPGVKPGMTAKEVEGVNFSCRSAPADNLCSVGLRL